MNNCLLHPVVFIQYLRSWKKFNFFHETRENEESCGHSNKTETKRHQGTSPGLAL